MISFSARGQNFDIPYDYIMENIKQSVLIRNLALFSENMVEKIDGNIFVDINPVYLDDVLDCMYKKGEIYEINRDDIGLLRELCYASIIDEYEQEWLYLPLHQEQNIVHNALEPKNKIIIINTCDKKKIKMIYSAILLWSDCMFRDIICGNNKMYLISETDEHINIWIDLNYKICNQLISIMRDGVNVHHMILNNTIIRKNIVYYGLYTQKELDILVNRIKRMNNIQNKFNNNDYYYESTYYGIDVLNKTSHCFTNDEKNNGIYIEYKDDLVNGKTKIGEFHIITNNDFCIFMADIKKNRMTTKVNYGYDDDNWGEQYYEMIWTYTINREEMEKIEKYYFEYLIGYID